MTQSQRERFVPFNIGKSRYYIDNVTNKKITEDQFNEIINANYENDKKRGYQDRVGGYYDKWYRYNRLDEGAAYDEGQRQAVDSEGVILPSMSIIPCIN